MYREENTMNDRLTCEIIRCIAKTLLAKAEDLERLQDTKLSRLAHTVTTQPTSKTHLTTSPNRGCLTAKARQDHD
jgi:hypothetical protein